MTDREKTRILTMSLLGARYLQYFVCPGFTPRGWWECDVAEVSKSGYLTEYEVKVSVQDFIKDASKDRRKSGCGPRTRETKHELLAQGHKRGPTRFFYVTPPGLLDLDRIPDWAGLIELPLTRHSIRYRNLRYKKMAPTLHRTKFPEEEIERARRNMAMRYLSDLIKNETKPR